MDGRNFRSTFLQDQQLATIKYIQRLKTMAVCIEWADVASCNLRLSLALRMMNGERWKADIGSLPASDLILLREQHKQDRPRQQK